MGKKKSKKVAGTSGELLVCSNPKAQRSYEIVERLECGIVLMGSEVKAMRARRCDLDGAYGSIENMELYLLGMHVGPYEQANRFGHEPRRRRKLLAHHHEIERLFGRATQRGYALVPLRVYFKKGRAKVEMALGKGRKVADNRETLRREIDMKEAREAILKAR